MAKKSKYRTVSIPRGVTDLIEELVKELGLWPSVGAFAREACLDKIQEEQWRLKQLKEAKKKEEEAKA